MIASLRRAALLFVALTATAPVFAQAPEPPADWPPHLRKTLFPDWIDAAKQVRWPPRDGCTEAPVPATLAPDTQIDRFGGEGGTFFSPKGETFAGRALPYVCSVMAYTVYRVKQALAVEACAAAP